MSKLNAVGWFDIYVDDMNRAVSFYESALMLTLQEIVDPTGESQMMSFSGEMTSYGAAGALIKSKYSKPGIGGTMIYFNVSDCLEHEPLVVAAGGKVVRAKFSIGKFGYITLCEDTEGNMFGLSSLT
jgi:predicted enzyme related to lactoylglutathione lyase